jgi:hypothetical protein
MNRASGSYLLNGWEITASEMYNDWDLTPNYKNDRLQENFRNKEEIRFDRLKDAQEWTKTPEAAILRNEYSKI